MNWFNTFNCRIIDPDELNITKGIFNNFYFWAIMGIELFIQVCMIKAGKTVLGSALLGTASLEPLQTMACWLFGAFSLVVGVISKKIPVEKFYFVDNVDFESGDK